MSDDDWRSLVQRHRLALRKRGTAAGDLYVPQSAELLPPSGQAAEWYWDAIHFVPRSGQRVGRQLARLCGDDFEVAISWRSLAEAVQQRDNLGRPRAYTERGARALVEGGWLRVTVTGSGRNARTLFELLPGSRAEPWPELADLAA